MHFLVTTPSGFEKEAIDEIKEALGSGSIRTTYFKGLLLGKTYLSKEEFLNLFRTLDTTYIHKLIPVDYITGAAIEEIKESFKIKRFNAKFAVKCSRRGHHSFTSIDVEREVGSFIRNLGGKVNLSDPEVLFIVNIIQDYSCLSVLNPSEILRKTPKVKKRWAKGKRPISRSELKMREVISRFPEIFNRNFTALDLGAAPGGWSRALSEKVGKVISIDNAELADEVKSIENIFFIKSKAEDICLDESVDILTNDTNINPRLSAELSARLSKMYLKEGGFLIHTVKTAEKTPMAQALNLVLREVKQELAKGEIEVLDTIKLKYNTRNEITIIGRRGTQEWT